MEDSQTKYIISFIVISERENEHGEPAFQNYWKMLSSDWGS